MMVDDETPLCVDVVDSGTIKAWFDYWCSQARENRSSIQSIVMINKLRRLTLLGANKAKRNQKAVKRVIASVFEGLAQQFLDDSVRIDQQ